MENSQNKPKNRFLHFFAIQFITLIFLGLVFFILKKLKKVIIKKDYSIEDNIKRIAKYVLVFMAFCYLIGLLSSC